MAVDSAVFSTMWHNGMSSADHLFDLVVEIKLECWKHEVYLNLFHISGNKMIASGMDGCSRGNRDAGISPGHDLRSYLPLDSGAFEIQGRLLNQ